MKKQKTEKKKDLKSLKKKRIIVVIALSFLVVLVGATVAYHTSHGSFLNLFRVARAWSNTTYDEFTSPSNWASCEEVPKVVYGKNTGDVPAAVRMKYEEYWKAANSTSTDHTTELPLQDNNINVAVVNLQNLTDWTNGGDGWYYYNFVLDPGDETTSLLKSVTLNCNNNFAGANDVCSTVNGVTTCTKQDNQYDGAHYHVFVTVEYIENRVALDEWGAAPSGKKHMLYNAIANQLNDLGEYQIDFTKPATVSDVVATANGNGVNAYTENGKRILYYRGEVANNYVIWGNYCWRILRTTSSGGVKLILSSSPSSSTSNGVTTLYCSDFSNGVGSYGAAVTFNSSATSPAHVGYTFGDAPTLTKDTTSKYTARTFANTVNRSGDTYYLGLNNSINDTWEHKRSQIGYRYHYYCSDGATSCDSTKIRYISYAGNSDYAYSISLGGYDNIADALNKMSTNANTSRAKTALENAYVSMNLDGHNGGVNYGDQLEDVPYCNDRTFVDGPLSAETIETRAAEVSRFAPHVRKANGTPSLDCNNKRDAYTVNESASGNGYLTYKIGLITTDEAMLGGITNSTTNTSFLRLNSSTYWTMSPADSEITSVYMNCIQNNGRFGTCYASNSNYIVPVVTIKAGAEYEDGGDGTARKPYVVKY